MTKIPELEPVTEVTDNVCTYEQSDYKVTWNGVEIETAPNLGFLNVERATGTDLDNLADQVGLKRLEATEGTIEFIEPTGKALDELVKIPVRDDTPHLCKHNDCGWCYSASALANDDNGRCNNPQGCGENV